jgi:hypothetical protein
LRVDALILLASTPPAAPSTPSGTCDATRGSGTARPCLSSAPRAHR